LSFIPTIRRISAGILLLLFAFSLTPKKTLHDFFAHHKDIPLKYGDTKAEQLCQSGFTCNCENLVVESPFTATMVSIELQTPVIVGSTQYRMIRSTFRKLPPLYFELRGPPAV
jgi:hypothetical protein